MPDPRDPSEPEPEEEEHGAGLAKTLREIEDEQPPAKREDSGSKDQT
jgi:hypothetical protein